MEINETKKISEEIIDKKFPVVKLGNWMGSKEQGYEMAAVDKYLDRVSESVAILERENEEYKEKFSRQTTTKENTSVSHTPAEVVESESDHNVALEKSLVKIIYMAEVTAKEIKQDAEQEAYKIREVSKTDASRILEESRVEAIRLIREAQSNAETLMKEANELFDSKEKEVAVLLHKANEIRDRLKTVAQSIEEAVS
jgi:cell division septum initiation protein DivIVA